MVLWFRSAMVPRFGGHGSIPTNTAIDLPAMLFEHSPCQKFNYLLFLCDMLHDLGYERS